MNKIQGILKASFVVAAGLVTGGCDFLTNFTSKGPCIGESMRFFMKQNTPNNDPFDLKAVKPVVYEATHIKTDHVYYGVIYPKRYFLFENGKQSCVVYSHWLGYAEQEGNRGQYCTPNPIQDRLPYFPEFSCKIY